LNVVIVSEGATDCHGKPISSQQVKDVICKKLNLDTRITVLGDILIIRFVTYCFDGERLTLVPRVPEVENSNLKGRPNLTQGCKRFATASTSTQVVMLPGAITRRWDTANSLHASASYGEYNERFGFG